jgi:membrane protein implicated in regulation of membrane protease activity
MAQYRLQFSNLGWRGRISLIVATAVGLAVALALIVLSFGIALVLVPVVAVAFVVVRRRLRKAIDAAARAGAKQRDGERTIEIDYRVIGKDDAEPRS